MQYQNISKKILKNFENDIKMSKKNLKQIQNIFLHFIIKSYTRKKTSKIL